MSNLSVIKIKSSLLTSFISATAMIGILVFTPDKGENNKAGYKQIQKKEIRQIQNANSGKSSINNETLEEQEDTDSIKLYIPDKTLPAEKFDTWQYQSTIPGWNEEVLNDTNIGLDRLNTYQIGEKFSEFKSGDLSIRSVQSLNGYRGIENVSSLSTMQPSILRRLDMQYKINSVITANIQTMNNQGMDTVFDDRVRVTPTASAGLMFGNNKYISAGFLTGETKLSSMKYLNSNGTMVGYLVREQDFRESQDRRNVFEVHTNIQANQNVRFQTAIYNTNRAFLNESGASQGARVSMLVGFKYILFNLKYNYSSDNLFKGIASPDSIASARDFAGLGVTLFLGSSKFYSVSIGNNYHNLMTQNRYGEIQNSAPAVSSFSASLRGFTPTTNTTFFLNFRNQVNRDIYYSNIGVLRLPIYTQSYLEYATALGLEMSF